MKRSAPRDFNNIFNNLCLKYGLCPIKSSKILIEGGNLDINTDRMTITEWEPLLEALKENVNLKFVALRSHGLSLFNSRGQNKQEKLKFMDSNPSLLRDTKIKYKLCSSIKHLLKSSSCLECLIWENVQFNLDEIILLKEGLLSNKSLRFLSFEKCYLGDKAFKEICTGVKASTQLISLNFSDCNLTWKAMDNLMSVIQNQSLKRHEETWRNSLRNQIPHLNEMKGLQQIILPHNPGIGDRGAAKLVQALEDDLWIRVIDLEHCGITDDGAHELLTVLAQRTTTLNIFLRNNPIQDEKLLLNLICNKEAVLIKMPFFLNQNKNSAIKTYKKTTKSFPPTNPNSKICSNVKRSNTKSKETPEQKSVSGGKTMRKCSMTKKELALYEENQALKDELNECRNLLEKERQDRKDIETALQRIEGDVSERKTEIDDSIFSHIEGVMKKFNDLLNLMSDLRLPVTLHDDQTQVTKITVDELKHHTNNIFTNQAFPNNSIKHSESNKEWTSSNKQSQGPHHIHLISETVYQPQKNKLYTTRNGNLSLPSNVENNGASKLNDQKHTTKLQMGMLLTPNSNSIKNFNLEKHKETKLPLNHKDQIEKIFLKQNSNISDKKLTKTELMETVNSSNFPIKSGSNSSSSTSSLITISNDEF